MKKLYTLLLLVVVSMSFGQTFYSENMGVPTANTLITDYVTGTAPATFQNASPILYSGTADVRTSLPSSGYTGASGGGNVFINAVAEYFQIDGLNTAAYSSANIQLTFGINTPTAVTNVLVVEVSTNGTTWTPITYTPTATGYTLATISGGAIPSSSTLSIRFTSTSTLQYRIDDIKLTNSNPACTLVLATPTKACDVVTFAIDTYTATIPYTGGGVGSYTITPTAGTVGGDNPNSVAAGNITILGIPEGTNVTVTITSGPCSYSADIVAPECKPVNGLPFSETFPYTAASSLGSSQKWTNVNTGPDSIVSTAGSLTYPGFTTAGNSVTFGADGIDSFTPLASTATGTVYYSYLLNVSSMTGVTNVDGGYISGLAKGTTGLGATLWTKRVDDTNFNLGIEVRTATAANTTYTTTSYATGTTYFVVVGYTFGTAAADDTVSLWINPTLGGAQPAATLIDAQAATATDLTDIDYFFLRQDSATETPALQIDELRVATTWAEVTSSVLSVNQNAIEGLKVYPNPVSRGTLYVETTANAERTVTLYDVLGKQVLNTTTSTNEVNVSNLHSGLYIVKITEEGKTATRKLIIE